MVSVVPMQVLQPFIDSLKTRVATIEAQVKKLAGLQKSKGCK